MADPFLTDLRLIFPAHDEADLAVGRGAETVSGIDNLVQALKLRLLIDRGDLAALGHPRYGTRLRELLGETMDRANRELVRRYVRQAIMADPRVAEVVSVTVTPREPDRGALDVFAAIVAVTGETATLTATLGGPF